MDLPAEIVNKYGNAIETLGQGDFGQIFKTDKNYAIKAIQTQDIDFPDKSSILDFSGANNVNSPYVVKLEKVLLTPEYTYMVMPIGKPIKFDIAKERIKSVFQEMCMAVTDVHRAGMSHQDIKVENFIEIPIENTSRVNLIDFGLVRPYAELQTGNLPYGYTFFYKPPEYFLGSYESAKGDVWALGIILLAFELGLDSPPFTAGYSMMYGKMLNEIYNALGWPPTVENQRYKQALQLGKNPNNILNTVTNVEARDLLSKMLAINPDQRISIYEVMSHSYFNNVPDAYKTPVPMIEILNQRSLAGVKDNNPNFNVDGYQTAIELSKSYNNEIPGSNKNTLFYAVTLFNYYSRYERIISTPDIYNCATTCYMIGSFFYDPEPKGISWYLNKNQMLTTERMFNYMQKIVELFKYNLVLATPKDYLVQDLKDLKNLAKLDEYEKELINDLAKSYNVSTRDISHNFIYVKSAYNLIYKLI